MKPVLSQDSKRLLENQIEEPPLMTPAHKPRKKRVSPETFTKVAQNVRKHREKKRRR